MSLLIKSNPAGWGQRSLGSKKLKKIEQATSEEIAIKTSSLEKIKDWFCGTDTGEISRLLYRLKSSSSDDNFTAAKDRVDAFISLTEHVDIEHEKSLKMSLTQGPLGRSGEHHISFGIEGLDEMFPSTCFSFPKVIHLEIENEAFYQEKGLARQWCKVEEVKVSIDSNRNNVGNEAVRLWNDSMDHIKSELELELRDRVIHQLDSNKGNNSTEASNKIIDSITNGIAEGGELKTNLQKKIKMASIKPWTRYKARRDAKINSEKLRTDTAPKGYVTMTYTHKSDPKLSRSYLIDKKRMLPPMRQAITDGIVIGGPKGNFKKVIRQDESYVKLKGSRPEVVDRKHPNFTIELTETQANNQRQDQLAVLKSALQVEYFAGTSIAPGLLGVYSGSDGELLAANGGADLQHTLYEGSTSGQVTAKIIPLKAYEQLCRDISKAHGSSVYFRDIKSGNLLFKETLKGSDGKIVKIKNPKVMMIDIDDMVSPKIGDKDRIAGTPKYLTEELLDKKTAGPNDSDERKREIEQTLKNADNYALLLCLLEGTSSKFRRVPFAPSRSKQFYDKGIYNDFSTDIDQQSVIYSAAKGIVKPEYMARVMNFLSDPQKHSLKEDILNVIDWNRAEQDD